MCWWAHSRAFCCLFMPERYASFREGTMTYNEMDTVTYGLDSPDIGQLLSKSAVFAHPYMMNDETTTHTSAPAVRALHEYLDVMGLGDQLSGKPSDSDKGEQRAREVERSQTERLHELCEVICQVYVRSALEANPNITNVLLCGTAELRQRVSFLEVHCGAIVTEQLQAVADFCEELWYMTEGVTKKGKLKFRFEVLSAEEEALCSFVAAKDGLAHVEIEGNVALQTMQQSLRDETAQSFGTVSWNDVIGGDGHLQGVVSVPHPMVAPIPHVLEHLERVHPSRLAKTSCTRFHLCFRTMHRSAPIYSLLPLG